MSDNFFANAFFGLVLNTRDQKRVRRTIRAYRKEIKSAILQMEANGTDKPDFSTLSEPLPDIDEITDRYTFMDAGLIVPRSLLEEFRTKYDFPIGCIVQVDEVCDGGASNLQTGEFLFGIGVLSFPWPTEINSDIIRFQEQHLAKWLLWVS